MPTVKLSPEKLKNQPSQSLQAALYEFGCLIPVEICAVPKTSGIVHLSPVPGMAKIDTGSAYTCFDAKAIESLNLQPIAESKNIRSASSRGFSLLHYSAFVNIPSLRMEIDMTIGKLNLQGEKFMAILGRDVLQYCQFFYDGPNGECTLTFEETL